MNAMRNKSPRLGGLGGGILFSLKHCVIVAIAVVVVSIVGPAGTLHAAIINPGVYGGAGAGGTGTGTVGVTASVGNDNANPSTNTAALTMTFTAIGAIDYVFSVSSFPAFPFPGTTEYFFNPILTT